MRKLLVYLLIASPVPILFAQTGTHEVRDGETLYSIARRYATSVDLLMEANRIESPQLLLPGTVLTVPERYTVRKGDTLFSIARQYETSVAELRALNDLSGSTILVGQQIRVPTRDSFAVSEPDNSGAGESVAASDEASRSPASDDESEPTVIPVAVSVVDPLRFEEGGAWPVAGTRRSLEGKFPGVMISASRGTPVASVTGGRIVYSGPHSSFGNVVFVQSAQGYIYVYGGQEAVTVSVGDQVEAGRVLGTVGISPTEESAALYFSVWRNNQFVDPEQAPRG